jgi:hypothetical protein
MRAADVRVAQKRSVGGARRERQQDGEKEPDGDSLAIAQQCLLFHVCAPAFLSIGGSAQILMNCLRSISVARFVSESFGTPRSKKNLTIDLLTCC